MESGSQLADDSLPPGFKLDPSPAPAAPEHGASAELPPGFQLDEEKYGGVTGSLKAAALGAARTMSLSGSDVALTKTGLMKPEDIRGFEETNPVSNFVGEGLGLAGAHLYGVGEAEDAINAAKLAVKAARATGNAAEIAKASETYSAVKNVMGAGDILNPVKAISKVGGKVSEAVGGGIKGLAAAGSTEGALFGAGSAVSEQALGDPDNVAESLMHHMGLGSLIGGGLGTTLGVGIKAISKVPEVLGAASKIYKKASSAVDQILADVPRGTAPVIDPVLPAGVKPSSIEDLQARAAKAIAAGEDVGLPERQSLLEAASRVEMENPVTPMQADSLGSQGKRDEYRILKEMPGEYRDLLQKNEALQKQELVRKTDQAIAEIAPGYTPTSDAVEGGQRAAKTFTDVIEGNRKELGPKIGELKQSNGEFTKVYHLPGVVQALVDENPKLANIFDTEGKEIALKKWDAGMGITKQAYRNIKDAVDAIKKYPTDFEKLFDIRKSLADGLNPLIADDTTKVLTSAKKAMMDYIQDIIQKEAPNEEVREWFKRYAINEENAKIIEKKFGAQIGTDNFRSAARSKPSEKILDNIFKDTESVKAAQAILSPEDFHKMLADHMAEQRALVTTDGHLSSKNFYNRSLKGNQDALKVAFAYQPELHQKIKDLNTIMRILPDVVSVNPSGTAKTFLGSLRGKTAMDVLNNIKEYGLEKWEHQKLTDELNQRLAGTADKVQAISVLEKIQNKVDRQITSGAKDIFEPGMSVKGFISSKLIPDDKRKDHAKFAEDVNSLTNNPQAMIEKITGATEALYPSAPGVTASVHSLAIRATQFLSSKVPQSPVSSPLSVPAEPSMADIAKFDRYRQAVEDPVAVLGNIKSGLLTAEEMETLQVVYPKLLFGMRKKIFEQMTSMKDPSKIPFQTKVTLSRFMGEPLSPSVTPQSITTSQAVYAQPTSQQKNIAEIQGNKTNQAGMAKVKVASRMSLTPNDDMS